MQLISTKPDQDDVRIFEAWTGELFSRGLIDQKQRWVALTGIRQAVRDEDDELKSDLIEALSQIDEGEALGSAISEVKRKCGLS